ncbi:MAG: EamA family transporter [Candidatus Omnitrophota bacterium]
MSKKRLTLKILLFLIFSDILETFTHFCFKKSTIAESGFIIKHLLDAFIFLKTIFFSPYLWLAFLSVFLTFIIWSTILSRIDLSVAVPLASAGYILIPIVSIIFLREKISLIRWLGIFFILLGVIFVSMTSGEKESVL